MPRIEPYQQQTSTSSAGLGPGPVNQPSRQGALISAAGEQLEGIQNDQLQIRQFEKQKAEERAAVQAHESVMATRSRWVEELPKRQKAASETAEGFSVEILKDFDADAAERVKGMPTEQSRQWLKGRLAETRLALQQDASGFEARRGAEYKVNGLIRAADAGKTSVEFRPDTFPTLAAEHRTAIEASGLNAEAKRKLTEEGIQQLASAAVQGMIRDNPYTALKELNNEKTKTLSVKALDFEQRQALRRGAEAEINRIEAEQRSRNVELRAALGDQLQDIAAAAQAGIPVDAVPSKAILKVAFGDYEGEQKYQAAQAMAGLSSTISGLHQLPTDELVKEVAKSRPKQVEGAAEQGQIYNIVRASAERILTAREDDPASYVATTNPSVKQAQVAMVSAPNDPDAAQAYARATLAEQARLGIIAPEVLPKAHVSAIASQFFKQTEKGESGEKFALSIRAEQERWGRYWPQVFGQLQAEKVPGAVLAIGRGMAPGPSTRLASVATVPMAELKNGIKVMPSDVTAKIEGQIQPFVQSLDGVVGAEHTRAGMYEAIERLTYSYLAQGKSVGDASEQAYQEVLGANYAFHDFNSRTFRVPVENEFDDVEFGAETALEQASAANLRAPYHTEFSSEEDAKSDLSRAIQTRGYWVTSADNERGLALFVDGAPVLKADGSVYEVSWAELRNIAASERTAEFQRHQRVRVK